MAAAYAHVTAPLRRLVDRFGLLCAYAAHQGRPLPDWALAVHDAYPLHLLSPSKARTGWLQAFDLAADALAVPELTRVCQRIHTALAPSP